MRNLLAAALDPTPTASGRERVARSFWSVAGHGPSEPVDLDSRRELLLNDVADDESNPFLTDE